MKSNKITFILLCLFFLATPAINAATALDPIISSPLEKTPEDEAYAEQFFTWLFSLKLTQEELRCLWQACFEYNMHITLNNLANLFIENGYADKGGFLYLKPRILLSKIIAVNDNQTKLKDISTINNLVKD